MSLPWVCANAPLSHTLVCLGQSVVQVSEGWLLACGGGELGGCRDCCEKPGYTVLAMLGCVCILRCTCTLKVE